jgi:hypothetical protein
MLYKKTKKKSYQTNSLLFKCTIKKYKLGRGYQKKNETLEEIIENIFTKKKRTQIKQDMTFN